MSKKKSTPKKDSGTDIEPRKSTAPRTVTRKSPIKDFNTTTPDEWQGRPTYSVRKGVVFRWSKEDRRYFIESTSPTKKGNLHATGIRYTFFAARCVYPKPEFVDKVPLMGFTSTEVFLRLVFRENDKEMLMQIRPSDYGGIIPQEVFIQLMNEYSGLEARRLDFRVVYTHWEMVYHTGHTVYRYRPDGSRYVYRLIDSNSFDKDKGGKPMPWDERKKLKEKAAKDREEAFHRKYGKRNIREK